MISKYIGLRLSVDDLIPNTEVLNWFDEFLLKEDIKEPVFACYEHKGRDENGKDINPHYHFMILNKSWTDQIRVSLNRFFSKKSDGYKSIQRGKRMIKGGSYTDFQKGYKYLCKGHPGELPNIVKNDPELTEEQILYYYNLNYSNSVQTAGTVVKSKREPRKNRVQEYIIWMETEIIPKWENDPIKEEPFFNGIRIASNILDFFDLNPKNPPLFMKRNIEMYMCITMNTLARKYRPEEFEKWKKNYINSIYDIPAFL